MILRRKSSATSGIFFAVWPRRTPDGWVSCEWLHWEWIEGWGWGSDGHYAYQRFVPQERYDQGERKLSGVKAYATPPGDPRVFCKNYNPDGPTPCHYPHCLVGGMDNCGVCIGRDIVAP